MGSPPKRGSETTAAHAVGFGSMGLWFGRPSPENRECDSRDSTSGSREPAGGHVFADSDNLVQSLAPTDPNPPLRNGILPGRSDAPPLRFQPVAFKM